MKTTLKLSRPMGAWRKPAVQTQDRYNGMMHRLARKARIDSFYDEVVFLIQVGGRCHRRWVWEGSDVNPMSDPR